MKFEGTKKKDKTPIVGVYILGKTLGKGSFGKVKQATHCVNNEEVAIKIVKTQTAVIMEDIEREIKVLKLLNHPNIVKLLDVIRDEPSERTYMVFELVTGGELFDRIVSEGRIPEFDARRLFRQMISAIEYCHGNLIAHRDLKPENMLMDSSGNIKVSDFGFSNFIKPGEFLKTSCGSPIYAAPEILLQQGYVGTQSDMWSLGVVLYAMVCGHLPWSIDPCGQINNLPDLYEGNFTIPSYLSKELKELLKKMINPNPAKRATLSEIKQHHWVNLGYTSAPQCYLEHRRVYMDRLNEEVLKLLIPLKFDINAARKSILSNEQCLATSIYHLFMEQLSVKFDRRVPDDAHYVGGEDLYHTGGSAADIRKQRRMTVGGDRPPPDFLRVSHPVYQPPANPTDPDFLRVSHPVYQPPTNPTSTRPRRVSLDENETKNPRVTYSPKLPTLTENDEYAEPTSPTAHSKNKFKFSEKVLNIFRKKSTSKPRRHSADDNSEKTISIYFDNPEEENNLRTVKASAKNIVAIAEKTPQEISGILKELLAELDVQYEMDGYIYKSLPGLAYQPQVPSS